MSTHCPGCHEGIKVYTKSALDTVPDHVHIYPCPGCGHEAEIARLTADLEKERANHRQTIATAEAFRKALARAEADVESLNIQTDRNAKHEGLLVMEREQLREDLRAVATALVTRDESLIYAALDRLGVQEVLERTP